MKIAVIGANGRTGKLFVDAALAAGHTVRAGVRHASRLEPNDQLDIMTCDATDENQLRDLLKGADAVASFIGHVRGSTPDVQTVATKNMISVMKKLGETRIISLTGTGVRFTGDRVTLFDKILNRSIKIIDPKRIQDGNKHVALLKQSGLDWTIIRALKLQNTKPRPFQLLEHGPSKLYCSREEVAQATLQVIEQHSFIREAPILGNS